MLRIDVRILLLKSLGRKGKEFESRNKIALFLFLAFNYYCLLDNWNDFRRMWNFENGGERENLSDLLTLVHYPVV